ncbi:MAG: hypothetical protein KGY56_11130 [Desulfobacterales bacterium]|nr:hypothetical protein [Desulfobacterales bacterium]
MSSQFTKEEYRRLMDLAMIANWVLHVFETEENPETRDYDQVIHKIYAGAEEMGLGELVTRDEETGACYPTPDYEEESEVMDLLEDFEDNLFWFGMAQRMALKTLVDEEGIETYDELFDETNAAKLKALEARFAEEFYENGLNNIKAEINTDTSDIDISDQGE